LNPALPWLIATPPGGGARPRWNGFLQTETHFFFKWLAIQFSETDRRRGAGLPSAAPSAVAVEGGCLYAASFPESTRIKSKSVVFRSDSASGRFSKRFRSGDHEKMIGGGSGCRTAGLPPERPPARSGPDFRVPNHR